MKDSKYNIRYPILFALALLMTATRFHHVGDALHLPDASMAVFFLGGLHVRRLWPFLALLILAVAIDWAAITSNGRDFWSHFCVTPAYWLLWAAYGVLWCGGRWVSNRRKWGIRGFGLVGVAVLVSASLSFVVSNGAFYWIGGRYPDPNIAEYVTRALQWGPLFVRTTLAYVAAALIIELSIRAMVHSRAMAVDTARR